MLVMIVPHLFIWYVSHCYFPPVFYHLGSGIDAWVVGIRFFWHPHAGWFLLLMPGSGREENKTGFVFRAGVGYDFSIAPRWSLAPEFNVEFHEGGDSKLIYGLTVSREF